MVMGKGLDETTAGAGESYAGIYVPTLAQEVLAGNDAGMKPHINLQVSLQTRKQHTMPVRHERRLGQHEPWNPSMGCTLLMPVLPLFSVSIKHARKSHMVARGVCRLLKACSVKQKGSHQLCLMPSQASGLYLCVSMCCYPSYCCGPTLVHKLPVGQCNQQSLQYERTQANGASPCPF